MMRYVELRHFIIIVYDPNMTFDPTRGQSVARHFYSTFPLVLHLEDHPTFKHCFL